MRAPLAAGLLVTLAACGANPSASHAIAPADSLRTSPAVIEAKKLAPQAHAEGEAELALARKARDADDGVAAELHAERATAHFMRAVALARLARATSLESDTTTRVGRLDEERSRLAEARVALDKESDDLERRLRIAKDAALPSPSNKAAPSREAARLVAARSFLAEARLLCGAARLIEGAKADLDAAEVAMEALEKQTADDKTAGAVLDATTRQRARCLAILTHAKRDASAKWAGEDAWLGELSRAGFAPSRDERGVFVTVRPAWTGDRPSADAEKHLATLGRVAVAQGASVQLVLHDGGPGTARDLGVKRGEASRDAVVKGGLDAKKIRVENALARLPIADPEGPKARERNLRLDVVFLKGK